VQYFLLLCRADCFIAREEYSFAVSGGSCWQPSHAVHVADARRSSDFMDVVNGTSMKQLSAWPPGTRQPAFRPRHSTLRNYPDLFAVIALPL